MRRAQHGKDGIALVAQVLLEDQPQGRPVAPHPLGEPRFAIGLGCEIRHAAKLVYATGMDLEMAEGTPIGVNCRLCERENCSQRAEPPITRTLILDENTRRVSSFAFSNAREL